MKTLFLLSLSFLPAAAHAARAVHDVSCTTEKQIESRGHRGPTKFSFSVVNLERGKVAYQDENESGEPVKMKPENSTLDLNDNYGIKRVGDTIVLESDSAGCQLNTVVLYERAGYTRGYARTKDIGCGKNDYTSVICTVRERE